LKKKLLTLVTAFAIFIFGTNVVNVYANSTDAESIQVSEETTPSRYRYIAITSFGNNLKLNSSGKLSCLGTTKVQPGNVAGVKIELQQLNVSWDTIKTWEETSSVNVQSISKDWYVVKGIYRLKVTHKAFSNNGKLRESITDYSVLAVY